MRRRKVLFAATVSKYLDPRYYTIITKGDYDVVIMSKNTKHYWHIHNTDYDGEGSVVIFHKHNFSYPYHQHRIVNSLEQAVEVIKSHDKWQLTKEKRRILSGHDKSAGENA